MVVTEGQGVSARERPSRTTPRASSAARKAVSSDVAVTWTMTWPSVQASFSSSGVAA